jgi:hypothetical protein
MPCDEGWLCLPTLAVALSVAQSRFMPLDGAGNRLTWVTGNPLRQAATTETKPALVRIVSAYFFRDLATPGT